MIYRGKSCKLYFTNYTIVLFLQTRDTKLVCSHISAVTQNFTLVFWRVMRKAFQFIKY